MFKNQLKIAWRNLKNNLFFTFLNVFGLAVGVAGALLIALYIYDELSYDTMFADEALIHRINADIKFGTSSNNLAVVTPPMASVLEKEYSEVQLATRLRGWGGMLVRQANSTKNIKVNGNAFADPSFFKMFGLGLLQGNTETALQEPNTIVISKSTAKTLFTEEQVVGKQIVLDNDEVYMVTGVIEDFPKNSFLRDYSMLMSMSSNPNAKEVTWGSNNFSTFIKLNPNTNIASFNKRLQNVFTSYVVPYAQKTFAPTMTIERFKSEGNSYVFSTIPLRKIHLHSDRVAELNPNNNIQNIYILSFIGLFLVVLASVNFMNLSTAQSLKRAKEVGVRKTLGSSKYHLIKQFLIESGLVSFIALIFAVLLTYLALPYFNALANKSIEIPFINPFFWILLLVFTLFLGLLSGSYPAFFMSKFKPVKVLKGGGKTTGTGGKLRNGLVVFQFAISVFLMGSTLVVFQQLQYIKGKDIGYTKEQVLVIDDVYAAGDQVTSFKQEIEKLASVKSASLTSFLPTPSNRTDQSFTAKGRAVEDAVVQMQKWDVDEDYISTLNINLVAGRNFNPKYKTDSTAIIVNETTLNRLGINPTDAIGMALVDDSDAIEYKVIGVVKDFHISTLRNTIDPVSFRLSRRVSSKLVVKLSQGDFAKSIASIAGLWANVASEQPFNYYFLDDSFNDVYKAEERLGKIFIAFTILSILIACLGLFGLATFNAEKRIKEIGVRKVLGASISNIVYKLTLDFLKLVAIAIVIAIPLAWFAMTKWLEDFSYRIEINGWSFILIAVLVLAISIITVSYQSIKAAISNPVKSLRTE
ncbi:ABC transporter permease [Cellulophaga omnivescoria]|uniref:ABC transporter permease n=1 Tax=Cellulophaga omnivescoria TaxID=1888890 RepID=UPI0022F091D8|nr:ABC transporter permease [Cellulophaga omnivescoria]WBU90513.1 ABC transporter permease [Cellulophaga omnivescoria]